MATADPEVDEQQQDDQYTYTPPKAPAATSDDEYTYATPKTAPVVTHQGLMPSDAKISPQPKATPTLDNPYGLERGPIGKTMDEMANPTEGFRTEHPILSWIGDKAKKAADFGSIVGTMSGIIPGAEAAPIGEGIAEGIGETGISAKNALAKPFQPTEVPGFAPYREFKVEPATPEVPAKNIPGRIKQVPYEQTDKISVPGNGRMVLTPEESRHAEQLQGLMKSKASERGMQYAAGQNPGKSVVTGTAPYQEFKVKPAEPAMPQRVIPGKTHYRSITTEGPSPATQVVKSIAPYIKGAGALGGLGAGGYGLYRLLRGIGAME